MRCLGSTKRATLLNPATRQLTVIIALTRPKVPDPRRNASIRIDRIISPPELRITSSVNFSQLNFSREPTGVVGCKPLNTIAKEFRRIDVTQPNAIGNLAQAKLPLECSCRYRIIIERDGFDERIVPILNYVHELDIESGFRRRKMILRQALLRRRHKRLERI